MRELDKKNSDRKYGRSLFDLRLEFMPVQVPPQWREPPLRREPPGLLPQLLLPQLLLPRLLP